MSEMLTMTKTYLIDDYYESQNIRKSNKYRNNNNNINNNNLSFNKCVHKLGDIVSGHQNALQNGFQNSDQNNDQKQQNIHQKQNQNKRDRHYSQQQLANNVINLTLNGHSTQRIKVKKDIDVSVSINSYESEEHVNYLSKRIEFTLKEAKEAKKLNCTEILIPQMLTTQIAQDIIAMAETEPCGLRGCILYVNIEEKSLCRRLGEVKLDKCSVPTFEMYLTLKRANLSWIDAVENKLLRKESVILSELYRVSKKKLYRSLTSP